MSRSFGIAITVLLAFDLWAGSPWKEKSYRDWDQNDLRKILNDSPWSKRVEIDGDEREHADLEASEHTATVGENGENDEDEGGGRDSGKSGARRERVFVVRWASSKTLREAWVRGRVLQKWISESDTERFLPPAPDDYQLFLVGADMTAFEKVDGVTLMDKSYLLANKAKQRTPASLVEVVRMPDGKTIKGILFHFPKRMASGQPIFSADEKQVEFVSRRGTTEIRASFDLRRMVDKAGMDF